MYKIYFWGRGSKIYGRLVPKTQENFKMQKIITTFLFSQLLAIHPLTRSLHNLWKSLFFLIVTLRQTNRQTDRQKVDGHQDSMTNWAGLSSSCHARLSVVCNGRSIRFCVFLHKIESLDMGLRF